MGECVVPEPNRRLAAHAGHRRSALTVEIPGEWNHFKYAGVPRGLSLPGEGADGESECVPGVVGDVIDERRASRPSSSSVAGRGRPALHYLAATSACSCA